MAVKSSDDMIINLGMRMQTPDDRDARALTLLCAGHFSVDMCQGVLPLLLPFLLRRMHLDYTATAFIVTTAYLTSSIAQPAFGMIRSRIVSRLALPVGVLLACGALAAAGQAHSYPLLLLCVVFSSLGVALYHPEAVSRANAASGTVNKGKGMSAFALCGSLGFSTGALIFGPILAAVGLSGALYLLVPGIAVSLLLKLASMGEGVHAGASGAGRMERRAVAAMAVLVGVVAVRQWAVAGTMTFLPLYFTQHLGQPPVVASRMMLALQIGSDAGTLCCGMIGQRFGYRAVLAVGMIAASPFLLLFPHVMGWATAGLLFCSGFALALPVLATTMIGQEIMPHNRALAASLTLGFGVGLGGIASGMLGRIADVHGIGTALFLIGIVPLLGAALGMALRKGT